MIYSLVYRFYSPYVDQRESIEEAISAIEYSSDNGDCYSVGVYDSDTNSIYVYFGIFVDRNIEDMVKHFGLTNPTIFRYKKDAVTDEYVY